MSPFKNILLLGCGNMGGALLECWLNKGVESHFTILTPTITAARYGDYKNITTANTPEELAGQNFDLMQIGIKPQKFGDVLPRIEQYIAKTTVISSIAAGKTLKELTRYFPENPLIRIMPNTPVKIGKGIAGACANDTLSSADKDAVNQLYSLTGDILWMNEQQIDALTPISGSGPAYLFYFIEAFAAAAEEQGFDYETALQLARQTIIGAAAQAEHDQNLSPAILRENVTSPGGVTEAALSRLIDGEFQNILNESIARGSARNKELSR